MKSAAAKLSPLTLLDAALAALFGLASLVLYIRTLVPGLLYGDSGEFQTLVYSLGMTHPTGYPVYVLLGRLFTLLPLGDMAWRVNLFSAVLGALTVACTCLIVRMLAGWRLVAAAAALVLATTPLFWYFSVITELYVPACAFLSGVLLFLLLWCRTGRWPWLAASALLGGLSLGVHSSVALAAPGVLVYLAVTTLTPPGGASPKPLAKRERGQAWLAAVGGALLGTALAFAAFLALDARNPDAGYYHATIEPSLSVWGMNETNFDSPLERLEFLYAARQFRYAMFTDPVGTMPTIAGIYRDVLGTNFAPLSLVLMGIGLIGLFIVRWREALLLFLGWGVQMVFITNYDIFDVVVFFVPTYVFLVLWVGLGLGVLMDVLSAGLRRFRMVKATRPAAVLFGFVILGWTILFRSGMATEAWEARSTVFMRGTEFADYPFPIARPQAVHDQAQRLVNAVEDDAIVFLNWDLLFPCYFVAYVEAGRTALDFYETYPQEGVTRLADSALAYIEANIDTRPVYFTERPSQLAGNYNITLAGAGLYQITRINE
jgi:Protein O-mannosyl-transferase TMEM260-like